MFFGAKVNFCAEELFSFYLTKKSCPPKASSEVTAEDNFSASFLDTRVSLLIITCPHPNLMDIRVTVHLLRTLNNISKT